ncbi:MAG: D-aminoacyl-tRNA deacylase [Acidobacteriota bacterium]|nr:D-aminoacyl-tRNA deacylase [Acidobacteriota bacterium]MDH3785853.1 D-aminoacyl-tRNA deacylase [Acidobacteriota bacterium]
MKALIQRVRTASVRVAGATIAGIDHGILVLLGVEIGDDVADAVRLAERTVHLRIFPDDQGKMNNDLVGSGGQALVVSQFTLLADTRRGRRPSYTRAAAPGVAEALYERYARAIADLGVRVERGQFRAMMDVELVNDGPVTLMLESVGRGDEGRGA